MPVHLPITLFSVLNTTVIMFPIRHYFLNNLHLDLYTLSCFIYIFENNAEVQLKPCNL